MKIVYVITQGDWGGAQAHVYSLIEDQVKRNRNIWVVTGTEGRLTNQIRTLLPQVRLIIMPDLQREISIIHDLRALKKLRQQLKQIKPDLVHLHSAKAGTIGRLAAFHLAKTLYTVHGWAFTIGVSRKRAIISTLIEKLLQPFTTQYICVSKFDYELGANKGLMNRRHPGMVIHNGVPKLSKQKADRKDDCVFRISMAARFAAPKRQDLLIRAVSKMGSEDVELLLMGDGQNRRKCQALVRQLGLTERVIFTGDVDDVQRYYQQSDVVALISDYEGLPLCLAEGMANGLPIIASNVGGIPEVCQENGYCVPNEVDRISHALNMLEHDRVVRLHKGWLSSRMYKDEFSEEKMLTMTNKVYEELLV